MDISAVQLFYGLLIAGLFLLGAELYVPGGIVGLIGGAALLGAVGVGFAAFPGRGGYIALGIVLLVGIAMVLWLKYFPKTRVGKSMTVFEDLASAKAADAGLVDLVGRKGKSASELRPAGFAAIDGKRVDVMTRGEMIGTGEDIEVIKVEGARVIVAKVR